jgi:ubiquinone/menaquinone biosynthesis C-methylase UbiE
MLIWIGTGATTSDRKHRMVTTLEANRRVHARLSDVYEATEPHFRPENQAKVRARLADVRAACPGGRLLDVGCGTGFVIRNAIGLFDDIHGVDITPEMMARIGPLPQPVRLHEARAEALPFPDAAFDAVTAYSFLDHVDDIGAVLREMARVLRPGGRAYIDLVPNRAFWRALQAVLLAQADALPAPLAREVRMVHANAEAVAAAHGVAVEDFVAAEPGKREGGLDPDTVEATALAAGFRTATTHHDWFLGQGAVLHGPDPAHADVVDAWLRGVLPVSRPLYKYLWFVLER